MKAALLLGGRTTEYHDFAVLRPLYTKMLRELNCSCVATEDADALLPEHVREFQAIVCCASEMEFTPGQCNGLLKAVIGSVFLWR